MGDLKERVLVEIERRIKIHQDCSWEREAMENGLPLAIEAAVDGYPQALRALFWEVERHSPSTELQKPLCLHCMNLWPCSTITDTARELGVE